MSIQTANFSRLPSDLLGEIGSFVEDKSIAPYWCTAKVFNATSVSNATLKGRNELMSSMVNVKLDPSKELPPKLFTPQVKNSITRFRFFNQDTISRFANEFVQLQELSVAK